MINDHQAQLFKKIALAPGVFELELALDRAATFKPGQYLLLKLPGHMPNGKPHFARAYSISGFGDHTLDRTNVTTNLIKIIVKLEVDGVASQYISNLNINDAVDLQLPAGHFLFSPQPDRAYHLLAAATGIAPYLCFLEYLKSLKQTAAINIYWSVRSTDSLYHLDQIRETVLQTGGSDENLKVFVTGMSSDSARGFISGRLDPSTHISHSPTDSYYICGGRGFVVDMRAALIAIGVAPAAIKFERFS